MSGLDLRNQQVQQLAAQGRLDDAVALIEAGSVAEREALLPVHLSLLKALGRVEAVVEIRQRQLQRNPSGMTAHHNLASGLGDAGRLIEAETHARRALALGGNAPETWLVLARALQGQGRLEDARAAFEAVLARRSDYVEAAAELSQLMWMSGAEPDEARRPLTDALSRHPANAQLIEKLAVFDAYIGMPPAEVCRQMLARAEAAGVRHAAIEIAASNLILEEDPAAAIRHGDMATRMAPQSVAAWTAYAKGLLVAGQNDKAAEILRGLTALPQPDQAALAIHATAMRALGHADPTGLDDANGLIRATTIDTPPEWESLAAFLSELKAALERQHAFTRHPIGQSLRHGTQTPVDLRHVDDPVIQAFFRAIDGPILRHLAALGKGSDPVRCRNTGRYRFSGCWSVRLAPGGFHEAHIHQKGWLSSACYIDLPDAVGAGGQEGWIRFGVPPFDLPSVLEPLRSEKPEPGKLVLFPSCMWHGTIPFREGKPRLTVAFDLLPD